MPTETVDYAALAKKYGGEVEGQQSKPQTVDYAKLAQKYGGQVETAPQPHAQPESQPHAQPQAQPPAVDHAALAAKHGGTPVGPAFAAHTPTLMERARNTFEGSYQGRTIENNTTQLGRMVKTLGSESKNPLGMTDEEWAKASQKQHDFFTRQVDTAMAASKKMGYGKWTERAIQTLGGAAEGATQFAEEMTSPQQVALLAGTLGESGLVRAAEKTGITGMVPTARTVSKLIQAGFIYQMGKGAVTSSRDAIKSAQGGDWRGATKGAVDALLSIAMATGTVSHEHATIEVQSKLNRATMEMFPDTKPHGMERPFVHAFDRLDPHRQAAVIDKVVHETPEYQHALEATNESDDQAKQQIKEHHARKLNQFYQRAVAQSWDPNAATRTIRNLDRSRQTRAVMDENRRQQDVRDHIESVRSELKRQWEESVQTGRQERRAAKAEKRTVQASAVGHAVSGLAEKREAIWKERNELHENAAIPEGPRREVESRVDQQGNVVYPVDFWGEESIFGVAGDLSGHSVYRQTPRGTEWLDANGNFEEDPAELYAAPDPETADTIARITSLQLRADEAADAPDATQEQKNEAEQIAAIRRDLLAGEIPARMAKRMAGIAEDVTLPDAHAAAFEGRLSGPFHESSFEEYRNQLRSDAEAAGFDPESTAALMEEAGLLAHQQTETILNHVYRPGDYIVSSSGKRWTLDSKGVLHSDDGEATPLMKRGLYSNQAMQLAKSGRVGYGVETREQRRVRQARERKAEQDIREHQAAVEQEMRLAAHREGLENAPADLPRADAAQKAAREARRLSRPPRAAESPIGAIVRQVFRAPSDEASVINAIANRAGMSPEDVMRLALASDPDRQNTVEGKIARLEPGDVITDPFRKDRPWMVVEQGGKTVLRSGSASPIPLDRLNPSDRVRQLVREGEVKSQKPEFADTDVRRAAFEKPHYIGHQERLTQTVRQSKPVPEPSNNRQAEAQAQDAKRVAAAAEAVATREVVDSLNPEPGTTVAEAEKAVDAAEETVKVAEKAYIREVEAEAKKIPEGDVFPPRAPASIGLKGRAGVVTQNGREFAMHYELLPIEAVIISHKWEGDLQVPNEGYDQELQPRTFSPGESAENAQSAEIRRVIPETGEVIGYNFIEYADPTINAATGPVIVEPGGRAVGGNTRLSIMERHLQNLRAIGDLEEREAHLNGFRGAMRKFAQDVGIPEYPEDGKDYVVVRMLDKPIETRREAAELGRFFNKQISRQISDSALGISYAKSFDDPLLEDVSRRVEAYDGIVGAMAADPEFFRNIVLNRFGIAKTEYAHWFERKNPADPKSEQVLSEKGRKLFEKALLGTVIKDTALLNQTEGTTPYRAISRALGYVIKMMSVPERDIRGKVTEALQAAADTMHTDPDLSLGRDKWMATYHPDQTQLLGMETELPPEPDRMVEALWRALHASDAGSPRVFNDRLKSFMADTSSAGAQLFGGHGAETAAEAFNRAFSRELRDVQHLRGDKDSGLSEDEYASLLRNREMSEVEREDSQAKAEEDNDHYTSVDSLESMIAEGVANASSIPGFTVDEDPEPAIKAYEKELESHGWKWDNKRKYWQKDGWELFLRSQGKLSSPIVQWHRMAEEGKLAPPPKLEAPKAQQAKLEGAEAEVPLPKNVMAFGSGANGLADMRGHANAGAPIGVAVTELSGRALENLKDLARDGHPIFVDSGAFSEVNFGAGGPEVVKPITEEEWRKRLDKYLEIAKAARESGNSNVSFVAPDMVGSQDVTIQRLNKFSPEIQKVIAEGGSILIPLQNGELSPEEFWHRAVGDALHAGHGRQKEDIHNQMEHLVPAFPMNKAAADPQKILDFVANRNDYVKRIHLLGTSMSDAATRKVVTMLGQLYPELQITMDANKLRSNTAEIGDRAREVREELMSDAMGETEGANGKRDYTEEVYTPSNWANKTALNRIADQIAGFTPGFDRKEFLANPDQWLADNTNDWIDQTVTDEYLKSVGKDVRSLARQRAVTDVMDRQKKGLAPPPKPPGPDAVAEREMAISKEQNGYVTPDKLKAFLEAHPATKEIAPELMRTARMMAEYVFDADPPVGESRKNALDWVLRERLAGIESGELKNKRGQYNDPNVMEKSWGDSIMRLHKAADASTFIHEFAHVIFPLLSDEDLKAIDTIGGDARRKEGRPVWDGNRGTLKGTLYREMTEKFAHGMEQFLRDENPTGFTHEVKRVLAKVKSVMQKVYIAFKSDPLSSFKNTEESREVFAKMFGITDFDVADNWREEVKKARTEEKRLKRPEEEPHPLVKMATEVGAKSVQNTLAGKVEDSIGTRVDPRRPTAAFLFPDQAAALAAWDKIVSGGKVEGAELIQSGDDIWGIRFNTKAKLPPTALYQDLPARHPGLELEDLKKRLRDTPPSAPMLRKLLEVRVQNLENEIRSRAGAEAEPRVDPAPAAKEALQEIKNGKQTTDTVRAGVDGNSRVQPPGRPAGISKPPTAAHPKNAAARAAGSGGDRLPRVPASLDEVKPVSLEPLRAARGEPVGTVKDQPFDAEAWTRSLRTAGLPENLPPPTWALDRKTAEKLIFPGQPQVVQTALSALETGDAAVVATATGTGKSYTAMAIIKEWRMKHPDARVLYITKNRGLLKSAGKVAEGTFGFDVEEKIPDANVGAGVYAATYAKTLSDPAAANNKWDLVIPDESGEARNWFQEDNKQGKKLIDIAANAKKVVYFSATPFHSPMEYGYLTKLNLWPKNGFDRWIEQNFAHEKIDGKVIARLDPGKQAKLRQQLIERGQFISQAISYEGFTAHFGVVPVTDHMKRSLDRIHEGFNRARKFLVDNKKRGLAEMVSAFEATYTKAYLERTRLPEAIEIVRRARENGWQVAIFSETSAEDLFRRQVGPNDEPSTYQQVNDAMGGQLARIIPPFADVHDTLRKEFGEDIVDFSGRGNSLAEREAAKTKFLAGEAPILYSTYAAGGIGVSLHDADYPELGIKGGDKPRVFLYLGPPYSGVLLEQSMGRGWRFGVKSDVHAVFLATDSEPDVRLMQTKIGPRMRALRASVLGEKDSLASVMASYNNEEKTLLRQQALAYQEGNEEQIDARAFQVRSRSRNVGINDWSQINFPPAASAKNRGMRYGQDVNGGDWSNLYQSKFGLQPPQTPPEMEGEDEIDAIGNGLATGVGIPSDESVNVLDPADKDVVVGAASASATETVKIPVERDRKAAARQTFKAQMKLPGDKDKWILTFPEKGRKVGVWKYTGGAEEIPRTITSTDEPNGRPKDLRTWYGGMVFTQEQGIRSIAKQAGTPEVGAEINRLQRGYTTDRDVHFADFSLELHKIAEDAGIDPDNPLLMDEVWDVKEGRRASANPAVNKMVAGLTDWFDRIHDAEAEAGVRLKTPSGEFLTYHQIGKDPNYMPHRIDWKAKVEDPLTGEVHTLKEIMGETFAEAKRQRIIEAIAQESNATYDQVVEYLKAYKPNTPVLGHIHRARTIAFPFIKKDWKTLNAYALQAADAIAIVKNFGQDRELLDRELAKIPSENGRRTIKNMFDGLLEPQEWGDWTAHAYNAAIEFEAATKMTISAAKVPYHALLIPFGMKGRIRPVLHAAVRMGLHPKETLENAAYAGAVAHQLNAADVIAEQDSQGGTHQIFKKTGFNAFYKLVRALASESSRVWMEQYAMHELTKGNKEEARRMLRDVMLIGDKSIDDAIANGHFTPDDLKRGQTAFTNLTTWSNNPLQMPGWARLHMERNESTSSVALKRAVRLTYALQSFSLKATSLLREQLWDEVMIHGNFKPLAYALVAMPVVGQMLAGTSAGTAGAFHRMAEGVQGKKKAEHKEDRWDKWLKEQEDTFHNPDAVKFLRWYVDGLTLGVGWDRVRRYTDLALNMIEGERKGAGRQDAKDARKKSRGALNYLMDDEIEQFLGPAWSEILHLYTLGKQVGTIALGEHTKPAQKIKKIEEAGERYMNEVVPITKQIPGLTPPPKPTHR
jgi:hypothetical protein